jgi:gliding motility-associated-like protein
MSAIEPIVFSVVETLKQDCFMWIRPIVLAAFLAFSESFFAQCASFVPNGGFEENSSFPNDDCSWGLATGWTNAATSSDCNSNNGTPDYFHLQGTGALSSLPVNYFSELLPFEGEAVMGIGGNLSFLPNSREYISIALTSPLVVGTQYSLSFSMTNGIPQVGGMYADGWGVLLSTGQVLQPVGTNGPINPVGNLFSVPGVFTSQTWETFTFNFTADLPYDQLTFGNFLNDANQTTIMYGVQDFVSLAYVFVDDFSIEGAAVVEPTVDLGADLELCANSIVLDASIVEGISYDWNTGQASSSITVTNPGVYYVDVEWQCGIVSDSITITNCTVFSVDLGNDIVVCEGEPVSISSAISGGLAPYELTWSYGGYTNVANIEIFPTSDTTVAITVMDNTGAIVTDEVAISVTPFLPTINLGNDTIICPGESFTFSVVPNVYSNLQWNTGNTAAAIVVNQPGQYGVVASSICNIVGDTVVVITGQQPTPLYLSSVVRCDEDEALIGPYNTPNAIYQWNDMANASFPREINQSGLYVFTMEDDCGTRTFEVEVSDEGCNCNFYIPNSFTPNSDAINDYFGVEYDCELLFYELSIFNRWGERVFLSSDPNAKWNGEAFDDSNYFAQDGIYNYVLKVQANTIKDADILRILSGQVALIR